MIFFYKKFKILSIINFFSDIFSVMNNPQGIQDLCDLLKEHSSKYVSKVQAVCAIESRGFLFGPLIALQLQVPFIPIRKKGKLPGEVIELSFDMEYGSVSSK